MGQANFIVGAVVVGVGILVLGLVIILPVSFSYLDFFEVIYSLNLDYIDLKKFLKKFSKGWLYTK